MTPESTPQPAAAATPRPASRSRALRHALAPRLLRESLVVQRPATVRNSGVVGLQVALTTVLVAALVHVSPWPHLAGFASLGALSALFGRFATLAQRRRILGIAGLFLVAPVAVMSLLALTGAPTVLLLIALSVVAGLLASLAHRTQLGAPGAVIFVFAASAALSPVATWQGMLERPVATALGTACAWLLCWATDGLRSLPPASAAIPAQPEPHPVLRPAVPLTPGYAPRQATRVALCAAIASLIAHAAGWQHPAWAGMGAIAVMQGAHLPGAVHRAWQRSLGTVVGAGVAWAFLSTSPSFWDILLAVVLLQCITEMVIGLNYALGLITITPMALLMTALSTPTEATTMAVSRIADTTLGAVVGITLAVLLSTLDERIHLARHHGKLHTPQA